MGLRLTVPAEWEIVRHGTRPEQGSLSLVDRRQQRLQVRWRDLDREPDLAQMIADHRARQLERDADAVFYPFEPIAGWRGLRRRVEAGHIMTRALRYDPSTARLLEAVVLNPEADEAGDEVGNEAGNEAGSGVTALLTRIEIVCRGQEATRWRAFDLEVESPPGWRLDQVQVNPADTSLRFKPRGKDGHKQRNAAGLEVVGPELVVRRMGMARNWYEGPEALMRKALGRDVDFEMAAAHHPPHSAVRATSREPGTPLQRWAGRLRSREDVVWQCERENAVYQVTRLSPPGPRGARAQRPAGRGRTDAHAATGPASTISTLAGTAGVAGVAEPVGVRVGCC
ncbi:MAG: hypothetical protein WD009_14340, partial [Phycisphaeraceae bacterium]